MTNRIAERRHTLNMTRVDLATKLGCTTVSVWRWETGKQDPTFEMKRAIAQALTTTIHALFPDLEALLHAQPCEVIEEPSRA
jgi:DNA-binding XRE family transcriptional regulator